MKLNKNKRTDLKLYNTIRILKYFQKNGKATKPIIAKSLGISTPTVSTLVDQLITDGFVEVFGTGESTDQGGKPPKVISFIPTSRVIISIYLGIGVIDIALMDLNANILCRLTATNQWNQKRDELLHTILENTEKMIRKAKVLGIPVLGIGVGSPGLIDAKSGIIKRASNYEIINDLPIKGILTDAFGLTVTVDNECNNLTLAEQFFGMGQASTFICLTTDSGIGAGVIINNQLIRGIDDSFGEIGHTTIDYDGRLCSCGNRGCWETYASSFALLNDVSSRLNESIHLKTWVKDKSDLTIPLILRAINMNDPVVKQIAIMTLGKYLGIGLANYVNTFNPELIIIHGEIMTFGDELVDRIESEIKKRALPIPATRVKIKRSELTSSAHLHGAGALVLKEYFDNPRSFSRNPFYLTQFKESGKSVQS